jgi:hypothetical protein
MSLSKPYVMIVVMLVTIRESPVLTLNVFCSVPNVCI